MRGDNGDFSCVPQRRKGKNSEQESYLKELIDFSSLSKENENRVLSAQLAAIFSGDDLHYTSAQSTTTNNNNVNANDKNTCSSTDIDYDGVKSKSDSKKKKLNFSYNFSIKPKCNDFKLISLCRMCWCNLYGVSKNQIEIRVNEIKRRNSTNINPNTAIHNYDDRSFHEDITRDDTFTLFKGVVGLQQGLFIDSSSSP